MRGSVSLLFQYMSNRLEFRVERSHGLRLKKRGAFGLFDILDLKRTSGTKVAIATEALRDGADALKAALG